MAIRKDQHNYRAARRLRKAMSLPEVLLWRELRGNPEGVKFRRQHPLGDFVIDFYCPAAKLGIEVDGIAHDMGDRPTRDTSKEAFLATQGIDLVRIPAAEVFKSPQDSAAAIVGHCRSRCD